MSAQTGVAPPSGPVSQRLVDRARYHVERVRTEPNPIFIRELKQAARLARTPIILAVVTILMTFLMASIGGLMVTRTAPATTGVVLFQVFFSLAYFVVVWVGPAVAANSIASEREGRTWEAVILTGLRPGEIARGKFLAAYTAIGMYIVMLAPVGALPFLFGGVTATEVVVAFVFLFLVALLSVAFGLAISSKMSSLRVAIVLALLLAVPASIMAFSSLGVGLSYAAHSRWPSVEGGPPIWLPSAYARAPFGIEYVVYLFVIPVVLVALPAWFLYEVTIANLTSVTDDRSTGLKRWFLVTAPITTIIATTPVLAVDAPSKVEAFVAGMCGLVAFLSFCVFLFQGDPIGPSRRVMVHWDRMRAGKLRRFLGPGLVRSTHLMLVATALCIGAFSAAGALVILNARHTTWDEQLAQVLAFGVSTTGFQLFVTGFGGWLRARTSTSVVARLILFTVLFGIAVGPWIVAAIAGVLAGASGGRDALIVAAPSPFYAFVLVEEVRRSTSGIGVIVGYTMAVFWGGLGLLLAGAAARRARKIISDHEATLAQAERILAEEDAARAAAANASGTASAPTESQEPGAAPAG